MTTTAGPPAAEIELDVTHVRQLLEAQHPDLADHSLALVGHGWDNAMFRLGETLVVRLPRREAAANLVRHEQAALPQLAPHLPVPVPEPIRRGVPTTTYPWHWSVQPWLEGSEAALEPLDASEAPRLAAFLRALHRPAPEDAPDNPYRGVPLVERRPVIDAWLDTLRKTSTVVTPAIERAWEEAVAAPLAEESVWLHADLHPRNVLTRNGRLAAVIDWGDVTSGDPSYDLAAIWMLLQDAEARRECLRCYAPDPALLVRSIGSAVGFGAVFLAKAGLDDPRIAEIGRATFRHLEADLAKGFADLLRAP